MSRPPDLWEDVQEVTRRLREEARHIRIGAAHNNYGEHLASMLDAAADDFESLSRRCAELEQSRALVQEVVKEMTDALVNGAFFNPEMFGSMLQQGGHDNPILRWRDKLASLFPEEQ